MKRIPPRGDEETTFDLSVENELLMLKLMAEFGAECSTGGEEIHPAVVNEFLKSVYEFEQKFREAGQTVKIYDKAGMPFFRKAEELQDKQLSRELKRLLRIMSEHRLELDVMGNYSEREIYRFITEELFYHEIADLSLPGYVSHFCYEDFHPNHELEIGQRVREFLTQWFARQTGQLLYQFSDPLIHPDTRQFDREKVMHQIESVFSLYRSFSNCEYMISSVDCEWDEKANAGKAMAAGSVRYDVVTASGESSRSEGNFQFYLSNENNWWNIFYFSIPGFSWNF